MARRGRDAWVRAKRRAGVCDDTLDEGEVLVFFVGHGGGRKERDATGHTDHVHACVTSTLYTQLPRPCLFPFWIIGSEPV